MASHLPIIFLQKKRDFHEFQGLTLLTQSDISRAPTKLPLAALAATQESIQFFCIKSVIGNILYIHNAIHTFYKFLPLSYVRLTHTCFSQTKWRNNTRLIYSTQQSEEKIDHISSTLYILHVHAQSPLLLNHKLQNICVPTTSRTI